MLGQASSFEHPIVSIGTAEKNGHEIGVTDILGHRNTTGVLGLLVEPSESVKMHSALNIVPIVLLAFGVGFATQRGSICGLLAARQFAETGRTSRLAAFVTASLWALVLTVPLCCHW